MADNFLNIEQYAKIYVFLMSNRLIGRNELQLTN